MKMDSCLRRNDNLRYVNIGDSEKEKESHRLSGLFYNLGRKVGPKVRKATWIWHSIIGDEADAVKVEYEVGRDLASEVRGQLELDRDAGIEKILNETGSRLAACVANNSRIFSFEAVNGAEPNAFALPGGFIFVTRSLMELCLLDKDEIAFILGHEMAHVIRGHAMNRIISSSAISAVSRAAHVRGVLTGWLRTVGVQFLESAYSQEMESQADKLGVRLADAAGYNPESSIRMLRRLVNLKASENNFELGSYFSSHPSFEVRIRNINNYLKNLQT